MSDPRETRDNPDTTLQGPGWLVFFQHGGIASGGYEPHYAYKYHPWVYIPEEKKALEIIEEVTESIVQAQSKARIATKPHHGIAQIARKDELELILRLRLQAQDIEFKLKYLTLLIELQQFHRQQDEIFLLLLH